MPKLTPEQLVEKMINAEIWKKDIESRLQHLEKFEDWAKEKILHLNERFMCEKCGCLLKDCSCFKNKPSVAVEDYRCNARTPSDKEIDECKPAEGGNKPRYTDKQLDTLVQKIKESNQPTQWFIRIPRSVAEELVRRVDNENGRMVYNVSEIYEAIRKALKDGGE